MRLLSTLARGSWARENHSGGPVVPSVLSEVLSLVETKFRGLRVHRSRQGGPQEQGLLPKSHARTETALVGAREPRTIARVRHIGVCVQGQVPLASEKDERRPVPGIHGRRT